MARTVIGLSALISGFDPRPVNVSYVVNEVAVGQTLLPVLWFFSVVILSLIDYSFSTLINPFITDGL
jgi:hypothetical protein